MALLLPILAFITGLLLAQTSISETVKPILSAWLARLLIPIVIIYNMVFYQSGSLSLMLFSFGSAFIIFFAYLALFKDRLLALCVSYTNMGWLGFPFAMALFGPEATAPIVALYIGMSLFGNAWAVTAVTTAPQSKLNILKKVLTSPPCISIFCAVVLRLLGTQHIESPAIHWVYEVAKFAMTFAGMCVLGMWLRRTRVYAKDLIYSTKAQAFKVACGFVLCGLSYRFLPIPNINQQIGVMFLMFCLPPAANIVALETHYQGTGRSAAYIASGTIVSCVCIAIYAVFLHLFV
ncbi:AEC family transporter [Acinetobacter baumannii]|uniref:AEC family transporter n=1 Tax=Acinetobacter baumannii TaxID=470 RepID=UPI0038B65993